jgi:hypothetical protein
MRRRLSQHAEVLGMQERFEDMQVAHQFALANPGSHNVSLLNVLHTQHAQAFFDEMLQHANTLVDGAQTQVLRAPTPTTDIWQALDLTIVS